MQISEDKLLEETDSPKPLEIGGHPFLKGLSEKHLKIAGEGAEQATFQAGELIFREGQPANRFYLVREGELALEAHAHNRGVRIQRLGAGDVLGWSWLCPPFTWHLQARALDCTRVTILNGAHLLVCAEANHSFGYELMKRVAGVVIQRLDAASQRLVEVHPPTLTPPTQNKEHKTEEHFDLETAIARHPFLAGMSTAHLKMLAEQAMRARFEAGKIIFEPGDPANRFYAIEQGRVAVEADSSDNPVLIELLGDGDVLGWSWLYPPYYSHFGARALEPTSAIFFYGTRLREACESDPDLGYEMTKRTTHVVIHRLQATKRQLLEAAV